MNQQNTELTITFHASNVPQRDGEIRGDSQTFKLELGEEYTPPPGVVITGVVVQREGD